MGWKTSFGDADEIEMEAEAVSSPGRQARLSQEESLAAQAARKVAASNAGQTSLFSMRNLLIAGAIAGGAYYLYKRRGE